MKVLLAEDDDLARPAMASLLTGWGYEAVSVCDGLAAWRLLEGPDAPRLVLLDWMMPAMDGLEVCRRVRQERRFNPPYMILVTARSNDDDLVEGFQCGANDYVTKPVRPHELRARLQAGQRLIELQMSLACRVSQLEEALARVKRLQGLLPICMYCKKVRNDEDYWEQVEQYISDHSEARFSHGICPECYDRVLRTEFGPV